MKGRIAIVEDQFIEANDLKLKLTKAGYAVCGIAASYAEAMRLIEIEKPDMVLLDIFLKGTLTGIDLGMELREMGIAFIYISANATEDILVAAKETRPYGFIVKPFREKDVLVMLEIAQHRHNNNLEGTLKRELYFQRAFNEAAFLKSGQEQKLQHICKALQQYFPFDLMTVNPSQSNAAMCACAFLRSGFDEYQVLQDKALTTDVSNSIGQTQPGTILSKALYFNGSRFGTLAGECKPAGHAQDKYKMASGMVISCTLPSSKQLYYLFLYSKRPEAYNTVHSKIIEQIITPLSTAIENIGTAKMVEEPVKDIFNAKPPGDSAQFAGIIGNSPALLNVLDNVKEVAPVSTSVLLLGESGTGKERVAVSIHNLSLRKNNPFIRVNCAVLPFNLIEAELFGYEKGAFTGAFEKRIGKFEQAHKGTIFLDEIGELPIELQPKLLRILQEQEIERIGGKAPIKVDVRVIAATNRNLEKEVAEGKFRLDLYYRLNIFPITMPPLRERKEDIPSLMQHFLAKFNAKFIKDVTALSVSAIQQALEYTWPGNIRELENYMERAVLLAKGNTIQDLISNTSYNSLDAEEFKTIDDNERDYIIKALKKCNGKVWGAGGAAELLNMPPSTLSSKMKKFGITRDIL